MDNKLENTDAHPVDSEVTPDGCIAEESSQCEIAQEHHKKDENKQDDDSPKLTDGDENEND
jgi:hypothetical protein